MRNRTPFCGKCLTPCGFSHDDSLLLPPILLAWRGKKRLIFEGVCGIQDFINMEGEEPKWIKR